jgi:hypothetical protein
MPGRFAVILRTKLKTRTFFGSAALSNAKFPGVSRRTSRTGGGAGAAVGVLLYNGKVAGMDRVSH